MNNETARADRQAARDARRAERQAARDARIAARDARRAARRGITNMSVGTPSLSPAMSGILPRTRENRIAMLDSVFNPNLS